MEPIILYEGKNIKENLEKLTKSYKIWEIKDLYKDQLKEVFDINNPTLLNSPRYKERLSSFITERTQKKHSGNWVYYPWTGILVHSVNEAEYYRLRTNRNRNLITEEEQLKIKRFCVGIAGLSVGSNIAVGLAYQGSQNFKLCEFDILETTNLNRIRAGLQDITQPKISLTAQQIYEIDPYTKLKLYQNGLNGNNLDGFVGGKQKPRLIFEVTDDFKIKILLRLKARAAGIPVIMLANVHDKIIIDVERYDLNKNLALFNGLLGNLPEEILTNPKADPNKYAVDIVGKENISERALRSVMEINKSLVGRPQLVSTVTISGGLSTYFTRLIALKEKLSSGRMVFSLDDFTKTNT